MKRKTVATAQSPPAATPPPMAYEPAPHERAAAQRVLDRLQQSPPAPRFKVTYTDRTSVRIEADHAEPAMSRMLLADALATGDLEFADGILDQLANVARGGKELTARELNFVLATVRGIGPRDPTEALLTAQMVAIHNATMAAARRLNHTETIQQQDSASNMLNKLARTFTGQIDALKRYRSTGEQNVRVTHQHVNVTAGQAVVGINTGGGGTDENQNQSHALGPAQNAGSADAGSPALLGHEQAVPFAMPSASREGAHRVPDARREGGSTQGKSQRRVAARTDDQ